MSVRPTGGKESLSWATPNTMDSLPSRSFEAMKKQATLGARKNRSRPGNLREQLDPEMCRAYIEASLEANNVPKEKWEEETQKKMSKMWPTPQAFDAQRGPLAKERYDKKLGGPILISEIQNSTDYKQKGQLNPAWVSLLMGFPENWTEVD